MQNKINKEIQFVQALNPLKNKAKVSRINNTSDLQNVFTKIHKLKKVWDDGIMEFDLIRYLPGMAKISRQGQICNIQPQRVYASPNWYDLRTFEFNVMLNCRYSNKFYNMHLNIALQTKKQNKNTANNIEDNLMTVNNFFAIFIK